jgi:8-oxo-dGTP pyrophosphatase MutT (NUDIX family)
MESGIVNAVGVMFYCLETDRYLYLLRNDPKNPNSWGLPGGKVSGKETLIKAMQRECHEELGVWPRHKKLVPIEMFTSPDSKFQYHTFLSVLDREFTPRLNDEHLGYAWVSAGTIPRPLHPGLWQTINIDVVREKINLVLDKITQNLN